MTNALLTRSGIETLEPVVLDLPVNDYLGLPRRSYDFNKGDRRFSDRDRAIEHANDKARATGVRQVVRPDSLVLGTPLFLVQAVGS